MRDVAAVTRRAALPVDSVPSVAEGLAPVDASLPDGGKRNGNLRSAPDVALYSQDLLTFLGGMAHAFHSGLEVCRARRKRQRATRVTGERLGNSPETVTLRESSWKVAPPPKDLLSRLVEITTPPRAGDLLSALNSGADVCVVDFDQALPPSWTALTGAYAVLGDAVTGSLTVTDGRTGATRRIYRDPATLILRPRSLDRDEASVTVDNVPVPAALLDVGIFLFHHAQTLLDRGSAPYLEICALEDPQDAAWWSRVLHYAESRLGLPKGCVRTTLLVDSARGALCTEALLWELRDRAAGVAADVRGFLCERALAPPEAPGQVLPDRCRIRTSHPPLRAWFDALVHVAHRHGTHAIGDLSPHARIRTDREADAEAVETFRRAKQLEVDAGFDGTRLAHPDLVCTARGVFLDGLSGPNQLHSHCEPAEIDEAGILAAPRGPRTEAGLRLEIRLAIQTLEAWLRGEGRISLYHHLEDGRTAELAVAHVWQWIREEVPLEDGRTVTLRLAASLARQEMLRIAAEVGEDTLRAGHYVESLAWIEAAWADTTPDTVRQLRSAH